IMADAAYAVLTRPSRSCTGNFFIDEEVLRSEGVTDFRVYHPPGGALTVDLFVPEAVLARVPTKVVQRGGAE
ncbi:MAG: hypothetical protein ACREFO_03285, partial [Acetobacteraceae bacterium]